MNISNINFISNNSKTFRISLGFFYFFLIFILISSLVIIIYNYENVINKQDNKDYKTLGWVSAVLVGLAIVVLTAYLIYSAVYTVNELMVEDKFLTDITRIQTASISSKELKQSLKDYLSYKLGKDNVTDARLNNYLNILGGDYKFINGPIFGNRQPIYPTSVTYENPLYENPNKFNYSGSGLGTGTTEQILKRRNIDPKTGLTYEQLEQQQKIYDNNQRRLQDIIEPKIQELRANRLLEERQNLFNQPDPTDNIELTDFNQLEKAREQERNKRQIQANNILNQARRNQQSEYDLNSNVNERLVQNYMRDKELRSKLNETNNKINEIEDLFNRIDNNDNNSADAKNILKGKYTVELENLRTEKNELEQEISQN